MAAQSAAPSEAQGLVGAEDSAPRESRPQGENGDGRRRSRDRYGRDRRERGERPGRDDTSAADDAAARDSATAPAAEAADDEPRRPRYPTGFVSDSDAAPAQPAAQAATDAPTPAPASTGARAGLPRVQGYTLPLAQLEQIAEGSGLQWVNSDAAKVAAVQAAIAAEPKPVHVPRERPAPVLIDEGPLVLVETRRDLSQVKLPFETPASAG